MSADLTPPADAPLPWSIHIENDDTIDLDDGRSEYFGTLKCIEYTVARYLVAAANAYPALVAERDAAIRRAAAAETEADTCRAKAARAEDAQDAWVRHVLQADERIAAAEADTVARIAEWIDDVADSPVGAGTLRDYGLQNHERRVETCRAMLAEMIRAGAWRGKEQA